MDGGAIQRAAPAVNAAPVRSDLAPVRPSAPLESPPEKAVAPVGEDAAVVLDMNDGGGRLAEALALVERQAQIQRQTRIEEETRDVVTTWVDQETGEVVRQFPAEEMLKLRAYVREWRQDHELRSSEA